MRIDSSDGQLARPIEILNELLEAITERISRLTNTIELLQDQDQAAPDSGTIPSILHFGIVGR